MSRQQTADSGGRVRCQRRDAEKAPAQPCTGRTSTSAYAAVAGIYKGKPHCAIPIILNIRDL